MPCCGKQREQLYRTVPTRGKPNPQPMVATPARPTLHRTGSFEYIGKTGLTVLGPVSGRRYRFNHPGAIVEVDPRDSPSMTTVPCLRPTRSD
jgi:hypothetical protein